MTTSSRLLFDTLARVYDDLGFGVVGDEVFRDLVIARIVEPTSILDVGRVLADLGQASASEKALRRILAGCVDRGYRDKVATACFTQALAAGDVSLVLYDVTTLYFVAEKEDELRKVGYSKERRVDPQVVVVCWSTGWGSPSRSAATVQAAESSLKASPGVVAVRRVRMRWIGHEIHADADLDIDSNTPLAEAHRLAHSAEHQLTHAVPKLASAVVHAYPSGHG